MSVKHDPIRLLGVKIAHGYSSEARVFAGLLGARDGAYDALVLHHDYPAGREATDRFEADAGVPVVRLDTGWRPNPAGRRPLPAKVLSQLRLRFTLAAMVRAARAYRPDVIYSSQQAWDCRAAEHIARRLGRPHVVHLHYVVGPWLGGPALRRLLTCQRVVTVSDYIRGQAISHGVPPERVITVRNALRPAPPPQPGTRQKVRAELGVPDDAPLIGMIARLDPYKGQQDLIDAFSRLATDHPQARLVLVGDGLVRPDLEARARRAGISDRTVFTGYREDVWHLLAALDVFAHPSRSEPFGLAVAEAAAAGLPVVAYGDGGTCEVVVDGESGLLAPPGDIAGLAGRLSRLLEEPELRRRLGEAGRRRIAELFRPEAAGAAFAGVLRGVREA